MRSQEESLAATSTAVSSSAPRLLQPGRNCWRVEHAHRFSMLVDAAAYFKAVRAALREARHSIFILSWDIDSRTLLLPEGANDGFPEPLGDFLHEVVAANPGLHAYVLNWDFAMLYALEREWLPVYKMGWRTDRRLAFFMDGHHPIGASHHQKIVVIDDKLAFVGGLDLTRSRWDTPEHACHLPLRRGIDGRTYGPFHDVQSMVDGNAARALADLCRVRWQHATGHWPATAPHSECDPWPHDVTPDLTNIDIAIARTEPAYEGRPGVFEVRQLYLDAIAAARRDLFFENQYFTSAVISNALAARLAETEGPEVAVISPRTQSGWLEEATMGVLRARLHRRLQEADAHGRYRLYCPHIPDLDQGCLNVHSKVFAMDDDVFCVGSANLSNRSMVFDTECNLAFEAYGSDAEKERIRHAIARLRSRLLAEHLDTTPDIVMDCARQHGGLHQTIAALQGPARSLHAMDPQITPELDALIPEQAIFDPEQPIDADELVSQFVPEEAKPAPRRLLGLGALAVVLVLLAVAWRWTPLREYANLDSLVGFARGLDDLPFTPLAVVASYVIAGLVMMPVSLMIAVTGVVFGPVAGASYAIAGSLLSAAATYGIGWRLGRETVRRLVGARVNRLSQRIARRGIVAMIIVRMLPIAPFTLVNLVAGASHISFRDFMIGTLLGMLPGIVVMVTFVHYLAEAVRTPSMGSIAVLGAVVLLLVGFAMLLQRLFAGRRSVEAK
ncbi:hypothetical protein D3870_08920 [Noviherbaspirillum cavernae]|uniref:PLD phosphodiesterase domain-containing protein n=1 Tax=Noviherbaspirillum cavernae TaxID=2320862 RepID=A0A418X0U0_9BURK|nr:VTT domain-containing protein [Noviherbaspirillum cavernae]RJG06110.1 hypothetical protein D3870_08920 [Noviherbaspirillum cavernae]